MRATTFTVTLRKPPDGGILTFCERLVLSDGRGPRQLTGILHTVSKAGVNRRGQAHVVPGHQGIHGKEAIDGQKKEHPSRRPAHSHLRHTRALGGSTIV